MIIRPDHVLRSAYIITDEEEECVISQQVELTDSAIQCNVGAGIVKKAHKAFLETCQEMGYNYIGLEKTLRPENYRDKTTPAVIYVFYGAKKGKWRLRNRYDDFIHASRHVLKKNQELYGRLADKD